MDFKLEISRDNQNYNEVDLFPDQQLNYDLDFYDSLEIDKIKLPFYTTLRVPLTDTNKASNRFNFDPYTSLSVDYPKEDFYFEITVFGASETLITGILNISSIEYNSSEPYIELELKDFLSKYIADTKNLKLGTLYGTSTPYYRNRHPFSQFLDVTANSGEAGVLNQDPDYTRPISFPYIDFCNDVNGKFGYAARQFLEYGVGLNRTGIMPVFSVPKFFEYVGLYIESVNNPDLDIRVDSKLFQIGKFFNDTTFDDFQPEKLHMVIPSQLLAKQDVNTRNFTVRQSPAWTGTNTSLESCVDVNNNTKLIHTNWFGNMETAGNYGTDSEGNPLYSVAEWGADKRMGFYPYDFVNGIDEYGIRGFFCPKVSFNSSIRFSAGSPSATITGLKYEIPIIQEDKMVTDIILADPNTDMTFKVYVGIYRDGTIVKQIPLQDVNGDDIVLDTSTAFLSQGYSNKDDYQADPDYKYCTPSITALDTAIINNGATWNDVINFEPLTVYFPENEELFIDGGSEYSINYFIQPLEGTIQIEYVDTYVFNSVFACYVQNSTAQGTFETFDIKKAITRIGEPDGTGDYGLLNIKFTSNADTFLYKTDDEFSIEDSINQTCPLTVSDILPAILKRFDCGMFYEFDESTGESILRIDPLSVVRAGGEDINELVDDLKSVIITNGGDKVKSLEINNKDYNLYFDDLDNDGVTIGSTFQEINSEGIAEIKIDLESSIYYKSVCGPISDDYKSLQNYDVFSQYELGFTENLFTQNKDVGLRFAYLDKPLFKTNMLVPYATLDGFYPSGQMKTESQIIFSNIYLPLFNTNIGGQHIFNGRLFHYNTAGWSLMFEEDEITTDSYNRIFAVSEKILQSQNPRIEFDMVVPTNELATLEFFLKTLSATRFTANPILVKSAKGRVFDDYAYLTIEGILQ